jgi:hypothetical protein
VMLSGSVFDFQANIVWFGTIVCTW